MFIKLQLTKKYVVLKKVKEFIAQNRLSSISIFKGSGSLLGKINLAIFI